MSRILFPLSIPYPADSHGSSVPLPGVGSGVVVLGLLLIQCSASVASSSSPGLPAKTITIEAVPGLQYDQVRFAVQPGQRVELTLTNESSLAHNLLITEPGKRRAVVKSASRMQDGPGRDYVPRTDAVLHFLPVLDPGEKDTLTFTAPTEEGVYPYVCTFPGHGFVMYGAMYVSGEGEAAMPPLAEDSHVPPDSLRAGSGSVASPHPYPMEPPLISRTFMPESSPVSIAVGLEGGISYCFDTALLMLRYAWTGGFVDNSEVFKGHVANQRAKLKGTVIYRTEPPRSLRMGTRGPLGEGEFRGYRMVEGGPRFRYTVDGTEVREHVTPVPDGPGLKRTFQLEDATRPVRYVRDPDARRTVQASAGTWRADTLHLQPEEARQFTITITADTAATSPAPSPASPTTSRPQNQ